MNRIFKSIWNDKTRTFVAASEIAASHGKQSGSSSDSSPSFAIRAICSAMMMLGFGSGVHAAPTGGQVVSGIGTISQSGNVTTINQGSQNLAVNWKSFNTGSQETVNFVQPGASALAVNRIFDVNGTTILGHLNANGQVWLINPNGILFGKTAQVNVGGLVAATLDNINQNGSAVSFSGTGKGQIANEGDIKGHYVALIGNTVSNTGTISADLGTAALGAGSAVTLTFSGSDLEHMQVDKGVLNSLVQNGGIVRADGGYVVMTAGARDELLASVVNNTGVVQAQTVQDKAGVITLLGGMQAGQVNVGGTLDASAPNGGNGGKIETSAAHVEVSNDAKVTTLASNGLTGSWLIDPQDYTIAASGGDMTGAALSGSLATSSVTIQSSSGGASGSGNINVNDAVSWSSSQTLTLNAYKDININANVAATNGSLSLYYGQGAANSGNTSRVYINNGASVSLSQGLHYNTKIGSDGVLTNWYIITSLGTQSSASDGTLQGINGASPGNVTGNYALGANIDASATKNWNSGAGFMPIGWTSLNGFSGNFDGLGHTVSNLYINRPNESWVGFFGWCEPGSYTNQQIANFGLINANVTGGSTTAAVAGEIYSYTMSHVYASGTVNSTSDRIGGLVGNNKYGTVIDSYSNVNVTGGSSVGGIVGSFEGFNSPGYTPYIINSYASGTVSSTFGSSVGGVIGSLGQGVVTNSYYNTDVNKGTMSDSSYGKSASALTAAASSQWSSAIWDTSGSLPVLKQYIVIPANWNPSGQTYPGQSSVTNVYVDPVTGSSTYGTAPVFTYNIVDSNGAIYNLSNASVTGTAAYSSGAPTAASSAGNYSFSYASGLSLTGSGASNYSLLPYTTATSWTVNPKTLTVTGLTVSNKVYDGTTTANFSVGTLGLSGIVGSDAVQLSVGTVGVAFADKNVGTAKPLTLTGLGLSGSAAGNYTLGMSANITQLPSVSWTGGATGNWSNAANWTGGIIPEGPGNVGTVNIPSGTTVTYDAGVPGSTTLGSVSSSGTVNMAAGNLATTGAFTTAGFQHSGGTLTVGGPFSVSQSFSSTANSGQLVLNGGGQITQAAGDLTLNSAVSWSANTLTLNAAKNINVNAVLNATGSASLALNPAASTGTVNMGMSPAGTVNASTGNAYTGQINFNSTGTFSIGGTQYTVINSLGSQGSTTGNDLQGMQGNLSGHYVLGSNIDASATSTWNSNAGFVPIGGGTVTSTSQYLWNISYTTLPTNQFTGTFDGMGHTISNLTINLPSMNFVGMFGYTTSADSIRNTGMVGGAVTGASFVGSLVGYSNGSIISSYATGSIASTNYSAFAGGLVGGNSGAISNSYATGNYLATRGTGLGNETRFAGGLVGQNESTGTISNSYATGSVAGYEYLGGLVGVNSGSIDGSHATGNMSEPFGDNAQYVGGLAGTNGGTISKSYSTGNITATGNVTWIGGFVGLSSGNTASISQCYSTGNVTQTGTGTGIGGFVGQNYASISNSYATGNVSGNTEVGGLIGENNSGSISNNYSAGSVSGVGTGTTRIGGLVGLNSGGTFSSNFWDSTVNSSLTGVGLGGATGIVGMSTANMQTLANFTSATAANGNVNPNWDFSTTPIWSFKSGTNNGYPVLCAFNTCVVATNIYVDPVTGSSTYGTAPVFTYNIVDSSGAIYNLSNASVTGAAVYSSGAPTATSAAGNYSFSYASGLSLSGSGASNYSLLPYTTATSWTVNPKALTISGTTASNKVYDGSTAATLSGGILSGLVNGDTLTLNQAGSFASKNVGNNIAVTASDSLSGAAASNYTIGQPTGLVANITAKALTVAGETAQGKVYDGTTAAVLSGGALSGVVSGDSVSLTEAGIFASKNAGNAIAVTASDSLSGSAASNYTLTQPSGITANITPASLTVTANNDAKFVTQLDASGYNGVSYSGFVNGETNSVLGGTLAIARTNSGTNSAGTYTGVLVPSGLSSGNYSIAYVSGNYTIVPANELLVKTVNASTVYGSAASLAAPTVQYLNSNGSTIHTLSQTSASGNTYTYSDGSGGTVSFTLGATGATSTSGTLVVGNYAISASNVSQTGSNFSGTPVYVGNLAVTQKGLAVGTGGVSKVYDGTTAISNAPLGLTGLVTGDAVTVNGTGSFGQKDVGTSLSYSISNMTQSGADASNYYLIGGPTLSGSNGTIKQLPSVTWVGPATGGSWSNPANWAGGAVPFLDDVANVIIPQGSTVIFDSSVSNPVYLSQLSSGGLIVNGGTLNVSNSTTLQSYSQSGGTFGGTGSFTVGGSFAQTGGTINAGGNVSVTQSSGPVGLGSITSGGTLTVNSTGDVSQLSGTSLNITGNTTVSSTGGSVTLGSSTNSFGGTVSVSGKDVTVADGGATGFGNVTATGNYTVNSAGDVSQASNTSVNVTGNTSVNSTSGNIALSNTGNSFGGTVSMNAGSSQPAGGGGGQSGGNAAVTSGSALNLGTVTTTGNLNSSSNGALGLGTSSVGGNLAADSHNGDITQTGPLSVQGTSDINAGTSSIDLGNTGNYFGGKITATGSPVTVKGSGPGLDQGSEAIRSSIAQVVSLTNPASSQPLDLNPSTTITAGSTPIQTSESTSGAESSGSDGSSGHGTSFNTTMSIAGTGVLKIVNGGMKLPSNVVSVNANQTNTINLNQGQQQ